MSDETPGPSFTGLDPGGVADFAALFQERYPEILRLVLEGDRKEYESIARTPLERIGELIEDWSRKLKRGFAGDWTEYDRALCGEGMRYAQMGVTLAASQSFARGMRHHTTLMVVETFGHTPDRVAAALTATRIFFDWTIVTIGNAYLAARDSEFRAVEAYSSAVLAVAPDAVITIDLADRITAFNPAAEALFGYSRNEILGSRLVEILAPEERQPHLDRISKQRSGGAAPRRIEARALRSDGSTFLAEFAICKVDVRGAPEITAFIRDLTEARKSEERLRSLAGRLVDAREEEGRRISREIHDVIGQSLTVLKMDTDWLLRHIDAPPDRTRRHLEDMLSMISSCIETVQRISLELRPGVLDDLGLEAAIQWYAAEFQRRSGVRVELQLPPRELALPNEVATTLYRILQEALTNVARHAHATSVEVRLRREPQETVLEIVDDGRGISLAESSSSGAIGVIGMRERALSVGGTFSIEGKPGAGTRAVVRIRAGARGPSP